jgi:hypothetical protein
LNKNKGLLSLTRDWDWIQGLKHKGLLREINVERLQAGIKAEAESPLLDWDKDKDKWNKIDQTPFSVFPKFDPSIGTINVQFTAWNPEINNNPSYHLEVVRTLRQAASGSTASVPAISILFCNEITSRLNVDQVNSLRKLLQPKLEELLSIMLLSSYSDTQIATAIQNLFSLAVCASESPVEDMTVIDPHVRDKIIIPGGNFAAAKAFQESVVTLQFEDSAHAQARGYAPLSYFDNILSFTQMRGRLNQQLTKTSPVRRLDHNFQIFENLLYVSYCLSLIRWACGHR